MKIKKLSEIEARKIAAGEVIERPANVVKELVENAIDAKAAKISIYVEESGKKLINVVDNGWGMSEEDAILCVEKHTTSKIITINDLETLNTFGFRGEALSSISSISQMTLITKEKEADQGIKLEIENGKIKKKIMVSANTGSNFSIKDIFYNLPARKKFLKSNETEWRKILHLFQAFCLDYKEIHFKLYNNQNLLYNCPPVHTLKNRILQLWNNLEQDKLLEFFIENNHHLITISGIISNHQLFKYDRNQIFFFVNRRWIKNNKLTRALLRGYNNVMPQGRYPCAFIFIELPTDKIDINIHPKKEEVLFLNPRKIELMLQENVRETLEKSLSRQIKKDIYISSSNFNTSLQKPVRYIEPIKNFNFENDPFANKNLNPTLSIKSRDYDLIGQFKKTYILIEKEEGLFMVDQHAAQERIFYEKFKNNFKNASSVKLLFPQVIPLNKEDLKTLSPYIILFNENGINMEIFGDNQVIIKSIPVHLKNKKLNDLIHQIIGYINENQYLEKKVFFKTLNEKIHAQMACKAAVKAGDILTIDQMAQLLDDLTKTENRLTCPHGRPTGWLISNNEIERKFKRQK